MNTTDTLRSLCLRVVSTASEEDLLRYAEVLAVPSEPKRKRPEDHSETISTQIWNLIQTVPMNQTIGASRIYQGLSPVSRGAISHELSKMVKARRIARVKVGLYRRIK
jgi:hypothetical protein